MGKSRWRGNEGRRIYVVGSSKRKILRKYGSRR